MPNLFVSLPMPVAPGPGASVDTSGMGNPKTLTVNGDFQGSSIVVEASEDGGVTFGPVAVFSSGAKEQTVDVAAQFMRVSVANGALAATVDVAANDIGALFAVIPLPAGNGPGPAINVSAFGSFSTFVAGGVFGGAAILVEISEDGVAWAPCVQFTDQGDLKSKIVTASFVRARVSGRAGPPVPFTGTLAMGSINDPGVSTTVTGPPDAIAYFDGAGLLTGDPLLTAIPLDPFRRPQIHDERLGPTLRGTIWRQGAWEADGDPTSVVSEGLVSYGANALGLGPDPTQGGFFFETPYSFGRYQIVPGVNGGNIFLVCGFEDGSVNAPFGYNVFQVVDNLNQNQFKVDRSNGQVNVGSAANPVSHVFINQDVTDHGSSADMQVSSLVANAPSLRCNQYGANTGIPGISTIKSRGAAIGTLAAVVDGDVLFRATAVGVPADNVSVPLAGLISIKVPTGGVGPNYVATDFEVQLVPLAGPINGRKQTFMVDSEGIIHLREAANHMAGLAVTGAGGTIVVPNTRITPTTKITLTIQDGGVAPTNAVYLSARVVGTSFTIQAINPLDVGVQVYYQLYEPTIP